MENYQKIIFELIAIQKWDGVEDILNKKIDPDIRDSAGNYLIHLLIYNNQLNLLKKLLTLEPRLDILDSEGKQICYLPIRYNQINVLKLLLEYNEINYGIDITNFRDCAQLSPLFYALKFNNINATELLLDYGARLNTFDEKRNTVLHIACLKGKIEFVKLFIEYYPEIIQFINLDIQIPLHSAILSDKKEIVKLLLKNQDENILLNSQDINDRTPLMYAIELQKKELFNELISDCLNWQLQDGDGNTHYHLAIKYNIDIDKFPIPTKDILKKTDVDGNTIVHLLLEKKLTTYFTEILENSSFLIQNNNGDTALHYLVKNDAWIKYKNILEKQKLSIFLLNKDNMSPYKIVKDSKNFNEFINTVAKAYYHQLVINKDKEYSTAWENGCSLEKLKLKECQKYIQTNINNGISFPQKKINYCIDITKKMTKDASYLGITLDIIGGLLLLKENIKTSLDLDIINNTNLNSFYTSNRIIRNDFLNFEIIWAYQTIFFPIGLDSLFKSFLDSKSRYFIIPIGIELAHGSHANILIYDKTSNSLERFEPDGSKSPNNFYYFPDELDTYIYQYFNKLISLEYFTPVESSPRISFQRYEIMESSARISDPRGFCGAWCSWYAYQRIKSGISMPKLIPKLLQKIRGNNMSFKQVVRNYANQMAHERDNLLKKTNLTIEDWFNNISLLDLEKLQKLIKH